MDYKKFVHEKKKQEKLAKKKQHTQRSKEVKFHVNIDKHDFDFKVKNAIKFLNNGHKLKVTIQYRGREMAHKEIGEELMRTLKGQLAEFSVVEMHPKLQGRNYTMMLTPATTSKKSS